jgi:hypothetical protein
METTTAFDLNHEITRWRQTLGQSPALRADNLDELESHLRDTVEELEGKGLSSEEAFVLATRRLGPVEPVEAEFAKVNPSGVWLHRVLWMLVGVQAWALIGGLSRLVGEAALLGGVVVGGSTFSPSMESAVSTILPGGLYLGTQVLAMAVIITMCWLLVSFSRRKGNADGKRSIRTPWLAAAILGGALVVLGFHLGQMLLLPLSGKFLSVEQMGGFAYAKSLASMVVFLTQTLMMALATILLAARLFGSKRTERLKTQ